MVYDSQGAPPNTRSIMAKGRKLVPVKGGSSNQARRRAATTKNTTAPGTMVKAKVPRSFLSKGEAAYARLLADPCNAPYAPGMLSNGTTGNIQRFETDFLILTGATETAINICASPVGNVVRHAFSSSDTTDLSWSSAYTFPGSGVISTSARYRPLAACLQVYWVGSEQSRQGIVALGNANSGYNGTTSKEIRSALPYVGRMPDQHVGIKWRPTAEDLEFKNVGSTNTSSTSMWAQMSGLPVSTYMRIRIVCVYEWEVDMSLSAGIVIPQYSADASNGVSLYEKAIAWLDKSGHWLLDNAEAIGQTAFHAGQLLLTGA